MANYQSRYTGEQIDAAVAQAQRIPTLEQNIADADAELLLRLQGRSNSQNIIYDPTYFKGFEGADAITAANQWLDTLHSTSGGVVPLCLMRVSIGGAYLYVISNVRSYAQEIWTQVALNGITDSSGRILVGNGVLVREYENGAWSQWRKVGLSTAEVNSLISVAIVGKADLVNGRVPASQLPAYVDEVEEYATASVFPPSGSTAKIYIALDTNKQYRWSGTQYVEISASLALGETSETAFAGNRGKALETTVSSLQTTVGSHDTSITSLNNEATRLGNWLTSLDNTVRQKITRINLASYEHEGARLPLGAYAYTYGSWPVSQIRIREEDGRHEVWFCVEYNYDGNIGTRYLYFEQTDLEETDYALYIATYGEGESDGPLIFGHDRASQADVTALNSRMAEAEREIDNMRYDIQNSLVWDIDYNNITKKIRVFGLNDYLMREIDATQITADKQDKLTAGEGVTIKNNVISASGGGADTFAAAFAALTDAGGTIRMGNNYMKFNEDNEVSWGTLKALLLNTQTEGSVHQIVDNRYTNQDTNYTYNYVYSDDENLFMEEVSVGQADYAFVCVNGSNVVVQSGHDLYALILNIRSANSTAQTLNIADEDGIQSTTVTITGASEFTEVVLDYGNTPLASDKKIIITNASGEKVYIMLQPTLKYIKP